MIDDLSATAAVEALPAGKCHRRRLKTRQAHPRAFQPLSPREQRRLDEMLRANTRIKEIARLLQRPYNSVRTRLWDMRAS